MKDLVPTVTSNVAAAGPIPGHGVSLSPSPPHIKPQLTKETLGGIMRRTTPFNYVWSVTFSVFLCHVLTLQPVCEELTAQSRQPPPPPFLDTSRWGQHQSPASSLGQQSGLCTHTHKHTQLIQRKRSFHAALPLVASSRLFLVCLKEGLQTKTSTDSILINPLWEVFNYTAV